MALTFTPGTMKKDYQDDQGYMELYLAIWRHAVEDDVRHIKRKLFYRLTGDAFNEFVRYDKDKRDTFGKIRALLGAESERELAVIERTLCEFEPRIREIAKEEVYKEALAWPNETHINPAYKIALTEIRERLETHR